MGTVYPISHALDIVRQMMLGAMGNLVGSVGELYGIMMGVCAFVIIINFFIRPASFGSEWLSIPLEWGIAFFFTAFMLDNWPYLTSLWLDIMVDTGMAAGGGTASIDFRDIGAIAWRGWEVSMPILDGIKQLSMWSIWWLPIIGLMLIAVLVVWVVYVGIALTVLLVFLAYYVLSVMAFFLLPFALWGRTAFLGENGLKYVAITGATLMALSLVFATVDRLVKDLVWTSDATLFDIFVNICAVSLMGLAVFKVVRLMQKLVGASAGAHVGLGGAVVGGFMAAVGSFGGMAGGAIKGMMSGGGGGAGSGGGSGGGYAPSGGNSGWQGPAQANNNVTVGGFANRP